MNTGVAMLDPGNPANAVIGRAYQLIARNLGGAITGVNRMNAIGSPFNTGGTCFAENADALPPGWKGLNEEYGFKKDESVILGLTRVSRPGLRRYVTLDDIRKLGYQVGTTIVSTSRGIMTHEDALKAGVGGEALLRVW